MNRSLGWGLLIMVLVCLQSGDAVAQMEPAKPGPGDRCPVCGMLVAKYPEFMAVFTFRDGTRVFFDGVKDAMKYYFHLETYKPGKRTEDIVHLQVTDYYTLRPIDGFTAFYVSGSDVHGPMGRELIPFQNREDADAFLRDHKGKAVFGFRDIHRSTVDEMDGPK